MPRLIFGLGKLAALPDLVGAYGKEVLIVTGAQSLDLSGRRDALAAVFRERGVSCARLAVSGEPTVALIDEAVRAFRGKVDVVVGIGGGSAMDAAKAIAAMIKEDGSIADFVEGVGVRTPSGRTLPCIAVPTTGGTGSEATKNAVICRSGPGGFKKSLRHDNFVPRAALIDPELAHSCSPEVTAACGLDAFVQLMESYVSTQANALTDALALDGIRHVARGLIPAYREGAENMDARSAMAYAAFLSGLTLANAGLGVVHGFAGPLGSLYNIPHGLICGILAEPAARASIERLRRMGPDGEEALRKYSRIGAIIGGKHAASVAEGCDLLLATLREWSIILKLPSLRLRGAQVDDVDKILAGTGVKFSPAPLDKDELRGILKAAL